ncbi:MAG: nucleotidyltransferase domain-containing protein [Caldisericia bacterium]|nr:nucleotidyltransferase domain-containing protein [Caldisericia bacterium]
MKTFDLDQKKREDLIKDIKNILLEDQNINFAYIFGSFVENNVFRDIDIGIYLDTIDKKKVFDYEFEISYNLSSKLNIDIDLLDVRVLNYAPYSFLVSVFKNGILLFAKDYIFLTDLIEKVSLFALSNEYISKLSLMELLDI